MAPEEDAGSPPAERAERRKESRFPVDGAAVLLLLNPGVRLRGRILDLSLHGCQFRTEDCFSIGIHHRIEIEFHVEGLPFRLAGVTQSIHDRHKVGVLFLNVSERKREQLIELIAEIKELEKHPASPSPGENSPIADALGSGTATPADESRSQ
jgi:c-di-GMP-binding flagellar brake protein YcgR